MSEACQKIEIRKIAHTHPASEITNFTSAVCAVVVQMSGASDNSPFLTWANSYSANYEATFNEVASNSANWFQTLTFDETTALLSISDGNSISLSSLSGGSVSNTDLSLVEATSANWNITYSTVVSNSSEWNYQGVDIKTLTAAWENVNTVVSQNSAIWILSGIDSFVESDPVFSAWAQSYSANFLTFPQAYTRFVELTGDVMTGGLSAPSLSTNTLYVGASTIYFVDGTGSIINSLKFSDINNFNSNYTTVNGNSANWQTSFDHSVIFSTTSASYDSVITTVNTNSGNWNYQGVDIKALTADWQNTFTTVGGNSSTWVNQDISDYKAIYVRQDGNDGTGEIGNPLKPFLTAQAAWDASVVDNNSPYIFDIGVGDYNLTPASVLNSVNIRGAGAEVSELTINIGTIESISIFGNGGITINATNIYTSSTDFVTLYLYDVKIGNINLDGYIGQSGINGAPGIDGVDGDINGKPGEDGTIGDPGQYGGHLVLTRCWTDGTDSISLRGGNGGDGGNGGNGGNAFSDGNPAEGGNGGNAKDGGVGGDGGQFTANDSDVSFNSPILTPGIYGNGGGGGSGGFGINGGNNGATGSNGFNPGGSTGNAGVTTTNLRRPASAYLTAIKTVDGTGSGLDSDLLDGLHAAAFSLSAHTHAAATTLSAGFMAAIDKARLNSLSSLSARWESDYTTVNSNSANWNTALTYSTIYSNNSANYGSVYSTVNSNSASWLGGGGPESDPIFTSWATTFSGNYQSAFNTVLANSAQWIIDTDNSGVNNVVQNTSANWNSSYTTLNSNSAEWENIQTVVEVNSSLWAAAGDEADPIFTTWGQTFSANYQSTFNTVLANSAQWAIDTDTDDAAVNTVVQNTSSNWNSVYTQVNAHSSEWINVSETDPVFTSWANSYSANFYSNYNTVLSNSASWDIAFNYSTIYSNNSSSYGSVYSTVLANSAQWAIDTDNAAVNTTVQTTSANWNSSYTTLNTNSAAWEIGSIVFGVDGGGSVFTTGTKREIEVTFAGTITEAVLVADQTGTVVVDVKKASYAGYPTVASICGSAKPTLSGARKSIDTTLSGWTPTFNAGDIFEFTIDTVSTLTRATLTLKAIKT